MNERRLYGAGRDQYLTTNLPSDSTPRAAAALVHGGYWRQRLTSTLMSPVEELLLASGWMTINIEYQRGPDHPWPMPSDDVDEALATAASIAHDAGIGGRLVSIGHSVGGQLVLLNHQSVDAVVALAPVTDTARVYEERLGDCAAQEYFQTSPATDADLFRSASPICAAPPKIPTLIVQGMLDDRVPPPHTDSYLQTVDPNSRIDVHRSDAAGHIDLIDPNAEHWPSTMKWMSRALS